CAARSPPSTRRSPPVTAMTTSPRSCWRALSRRTGDGASSPQVLEDAGGGPSAGEEAAAEEGALERVVPVHSAAAEAARLTSGVEPRRPLDPAAEVGLEPAEGLAQQHVQAHGDERARGRVEQAVRPRGADQAVTEIRAGAAQRGDLRVLREAVRHLRVPGPDHALERTGVDQLLTGQRVHLGHEVLDGLRLEEVLAVVEEGLHRAGRPRPDATEHLPDVLAGEVRVLLAAGERELLLDDLPGEHEPGVVVPGGAQV